MANEVIKAGLALLGEFLENELRKELAKQGHIARSDLLDSIDLFVEETPTKIILKGKFLDYGEFVDRGRRKGSMPPIEALEDWIRVKGIERDAKKVRGVAFAIAKTIEKKGIPTDGDRDKLGWVSKTLDDNLAFIISSVEKAAGAQFNVNISNLVKETNQRFATI